MLYECSMKWSDVAIAFTFSSRALFVLNMAEKQSYPYDNCRLVQWAWLKVRRIDALHANRRILIIDAIDDVDESLQP